MNTPADTGDGRLQLGGDRAMSGQANTSSTTGTFTQQNRRGMLLPGRSDVRKLLPQSESGLPLLTVPTCLPVAMKPESAATV